MYGGAIRYVMPLLDFQSIIGVADNSRAYLVTTDEYWLVCCSWVFQTDRYYWIGGCRTYSV